MPNLSLEDKLKSAILLCTQWLSENRHYSGKELLDATASAAKKQDSDVISVTIALNGAGGYKYFLFNVTSTETVELKRESY